MFVCLNNDKDATQKIIKSVTYHLHPTARPAVIKVTEAPFLLSKVGWGYYEIKIEIQFKKWTGLGNKTVAHELCFEGRGKTQSFDMDIGKKEETVKELAKLMDELQISK